MWYFRNTFKSFANLQNALSYTLSPFFVTQNWNESRIKNLFLDLITVKIWIYRNVLYRSRERIVAERVSERVSVTNEWANKWRRWSEHELVWSFTVRLSFFGSGGGFFREIEGIEKFGKREISVFAKVGSLGLFFVSLDRAFKLVKKCKNSGYISSRSKHGIVTLIYWLVAHFVQICLKRLDTFSLKQRLMGKQTSFQSWFRFWQGWVSSNVTDF